MKISETNIDRVTGGEPRPELPVRVDSRDIWNDRGLQDSLEASYLISQNRVSAANSELNATFTQGTVLETAQRIPYF